MNTPRQPNEPPIIKARLGDTDPMMTTVLHDGALEPGKQTVLIPQQGRIRRRPAAWQVVGITALLLGLIGLSTWFYLQRHEKVEDDSGMMPSNPVALVNSSTPIAQRYSPLTTKDTVGEITYAPESDSWSPALREAHRAQEDGRYSSAIAQYSALSASSDSNEAHDALWALASAYADSGQPDLAIRTYSLFTYLRTDPRAAQAYYKIAQLHEGIMEWSEAVRAYEEYARYAGPARNFAILQEARLLGNTPDARDLYGKVLNNNPQAPDMRTALGQLAQVELALSRPAFLPGSTMTDAIKLYDTLAAERNGNPRPILDHSGDPPEVLAAREMARTGDKAGARKRLLDYIGRECPGAQAACPYYAEGRFSALMELVNLEPSTVVSGTFSAMQAAHIAFDATYYRQSLSFMESLRSQSSDPAVRAEAALLSGRAYSRLGDPATAYNWYTATAQTYPNSAQAPEALRRAGDALGLQGAWDQALGAYADAIGRYPNSPEADVARVNAAVLAYRLEQRDTALGLLQPIEAKSTLTTTLRQEALFWLGKLQKAQGGSDWKATLQKAVDVSPATYLSLRARSLVAGEPGDGPRVPSYDTSGVLTDSLGVQYSSEAADRRALLSWAASLDSKHAQAEASPTAESSSATDRMDSRLAKDPEVQRAVALLRLNKDEGYKAMQAVAERLKYQGDASGLAQLTIYTRYHADPRTAMSVAETLASIAPEKSDPFKWPTLLLKTLYPTPYSGLVTGEASTRKIDPLLVYALMRQESRFVPDALSHADAYGLTQVIPSTAEGIAEQLGDTGYVTSNLYLPYVNIRYGTYYLASNLPQFDNRLLPVLAAYNGGPGNAARWLDGSALIDPDLYRERIDLFETDNYLEIVYENYGFYRHIYSK